MKMEDLETEFNLLKEFLFKFDKHKAAGLVDFIPSFVVEHSGVEIQNIIFQGIRLLKCPLERFPVEWIAEFTCHLIKIPDHIRIKTGYYDWIKHLVIELEREARKQGKLSPDFDGLLKDVYDWEELKNKFGWISMLLWDFNSDICGPNVKDKVIIAKFVSETEGVQIQETIDQGKEFLKIPVKKFPDYWISDITNKLPTITEGDVVHILEDTKENYYEWFKRTIEEVEKEAKRQGKL